MGKVEKVIVLSVLFLIALILVVSLTVDDPLNKAGVVEAGAPPAPSSTVLSIPAPAAEKAADTNLARAQPGARSEGMLSTQLIPGATSPAPETAQPPQPETAPAAQPAPAASVQPTILTLAPTAPVLPAGALLKKLDGLQDSILPDMKLYTWKEGDSFKALAQTYYGNGDKMTVLKRSNEGRTDVKPGNTVFIPVFDSDRGGSPAVPRGERVADSKAVAGRGFHVVADGESLWKIAKKELGNGGRWKEIYDLNRDTLASPEALHKGQRLRLP